MYSQKLTVMPSDTACTNEMKVRNLLNRLQDVAGMAVADREGSPGELLRRGYAWVLLKYGLEVVKRMPEMDESFTVETRHTPGDGFHTLRVFRIFNELGTLLLAKTSWVLIDLAAGRPVRATQHLPEVFADVEDEGDIDPEFAVIPRLKDLSPVHEAVFPVRFHDIDANGHVNNAVYFEWAYEATPLDLLGWGIREMHAEFRVSAKLGDTVRVEVRKICAENGGGLGRTFVYDMTNLGNPKRGEPNERPLVRLRAVWTPLGNGG